MKTKAVSSITSTGKKKGRVLSINRMRWKKSWESLQRYGRSKAKALGINSEHDIERLIDEGRT